MAHRKLAGLPQDLQLADPGRKLMFDDRLYERGGLVLHAVRCALGDEAFFRMLRAWAALHRGGAVTTEAFTRHVARYAADSLDDLFAAWLHETALPPLPSASGAVIPARPPYPPTNI
jgi:aminopeptidase N